MNDGTGMPQTAVVIGGTSDIGRSILKALVARRLRRVVLAGRDDKGLQSVADELLALGATSVETVFCDVTDTAAHNALARQAAEQLGQIDLVLVTAATLGDQGRDENDPAAAARVLDTNFTGPAAALLAFAAVLRAQGHGRIVVLSSVAGVRVRRANFVYGSSKAGLDGFAGGEPGDQFVGGGGDHVAGRVDQIGQGRVGLVVGQGQTGGQRRSGAGGAGQVEAVEGGLADVALAAVASTAREVAWPNAPAMVTEASASPAAAGVVMCTVKARIQPRPSPSRAAHAGM